MSKKIKDYEVQDRAFTSLCNEFAIEAKKGEKSLSKLMIDFAKSHDYIENDMWKYKSSISNLRFLERGANGEYEANNFSSHMSAGLKLWDDYLQDIGRRHSGTGCIYDNRYEVEKLMKQNGPKKMEHRLRQYVRRRIKSAQKNIR